MMMYTMRATGPATGGTTATLTAIMVIAMALSVGGKEIGSIDVHEEPNGNVHT